MKIMLHHSSSSSLLFKMNSSLLTIVWASILSLIIFQVHQVSSLFCYSCVSTTPGCTLEQVSWWIYSSITCPESDDKCIKIIEQDGADIRVTRDCLSNVMSLRDDVPADRFEGCRSAAQNPKRAVYVDNAIGELDLKKSSFINTTYCFCEFDQWCNGSSSRNSTWTILVTIFMLLVYWI
ncbi:hypothetical protein DERF_003129 [Dermatophagoides farinae]|uniref:Protein sleepless n=1 Tax=Dermatophagoides farinae TaxID=6954 RepID=A0A922IC02_DERFA|nr:hypothetical protein DERF_003129 [Dermatophagoides farinae]